MAGKHGSRVGTVDMGRQLSWVAGWTVLMTTDRWTDRLKS